MDDYLALSARFERLRQIIVLRENSLREMEKEVLHWFQVGNLSEIERLMKEKEQIKLTNQKLRLFVLKWEEEYSDDRLGKQLYTSV